MKRYIAIVLFLIYIILIQACKYNSPEGFTEQHHTYEEIVAFAKSIDPNATVSEEYTDTTIDDWNRDFREWSAVICGIECHVSSVGDMVWNDGFLAGEFAKQYYVIDTDYDYYLLQQIVSEKQPDWKMSYDDISSRYNWNNLLSVETSYTENRQLTDVELETAWQEAFEIYTEYNSHPVRKEAWFSVAAPAIYVDGNGENEHIKITSDIMNDFSEEGKTKFFNEYRESWGLLESGLLIVE